MDEASQFTGGEHGIHVRQSSLHHLFPLSLEFLAVQGIMLTE